MQNTLTFSILTLFLLLAGTIRAQENTPADSVLMHQYVQRADALEQAGAYDSCLVYYQRAYDIAASLALWPAALDYAASVSYFHGSLEHPEEERQWVWRVKEIAEAHFGGKGENAGLAFNTLGTFYNNQRNLDSALFYYRQALELYAQSRGRYNPEIIGIYQNLTNCYKRKRAYGKARDIFEEGLKSEQHFVDSIPFPFAFYYNAGAQVYERLNRYEKAIAFYQKALQVLEKTPDHPERATSLYGLAKIYRDKGYYKEALEQFLEVLEMDLRTFGESHSYIIVDYQSISRTYLLMNEFENARLYAQKALSIAQQVRGKEAPDNGPLMVSLAHALNQLDRKKEARELMQTVVERERKAWGSRHPTLAIHTGILAGMYAEQGDLANAIELQQQGLQLLESLPAPPPSHIADGYAALGRLHHRNGDHRKALAFFQRERRLLLDYLRENHPHLADNYRNQAEQYLALNRQEEALEKVGKAIQLLLPEGSKTTGSYIPSPAHLQGINIRSAMSLYEAMRTLATVLQARDDHPAALQCYERALLLRERLFSQLRTEASRLISRADSRRFFENAIDLAYRLYEKTGDVQYAERAFHLMEKSKAAVLQAGLRDRRAMAFAGLPDSLLQQERQLKADINFASQKLHDLRYSKEAGEQEQLSFWEQELFSAHQTYQAWKSNIENLHPAYYRLKYDRQTPNIGELQRKILEDKTALAAFFLGEKSLYTCFMDANSVQMQKKEVDEGFSDRLFSFTEMLRDPQLAYEKGNDAALFRQFHEEGHYLYETLLGPFGSAIPPHLIVIPDGPLGLLPFELLLTAEGDLLTVDYAALPYLLKKTDIRYGYSAGLLTRHREPTSATSGRLLAVAPAYGEAPLAMARTTYAALQFARTEAEAVSALSGGDLLLGAQATERQFKELAAGYGLLHLAMHTRMEAEDPLFSGLIFSTVSDSTEDHILRAYELYNLSLPTELVVLSACNTGSGQVAPGEGIMSLARAFRYAGSPNIVMSLWQVDDQATRQIMTHFYRYLEKGKGKAEALRLAKLDYLDQERKKMPYFWGAFVLQGDNEPVAFDSALSWWWGLPVGIGLLGLVVWWKRKS